MKAEQVARAKIPVRIPTMSIVISVSARTEEALTEALHRLVLRRRQQEAAAAVERNNYILECVRKNRSPDPDFKPAPGSRWPSTASFLTPEEKQQVASINPHTPEAA
jgi:hypothetical protein